MKHKPLPSTTKPNTHLMTMLEAVNTYQVPGAAGELDPVDITSTGWSKHVPGTILSGVGVICLGMPTGFNRLGCLPIEHFTLKIFPTFEAHWGFNKFNVPVWKYLDEHGNTLVRGLQPRVNYPFVHVIIGNHLDKIDCLEITDQDLLDMD